MTSEKTPNLGLNQIDRTSPKTTYFDLEKYLDQNWRSVDDFAGDVNDGVNAIKKRLDTTERKTVTLEPGVQIVHAEKAAPFSLTGLSGRTLVNLLGRDGNCEATTGWNVTGTLEIDTATRTSGANSIKVSLNAASGNINRAVNTVSGKMYVLLADLKNGSTSRAYVSVNGVANGNDVTGTVFGTSFLRFTATSTSHVVAAVGSGTSGNAFNVDSFRLYEVSSDEYAALASMTADQVAANYPYVDSVAPVRNPYVIRYGENLLPNFYEWTKTGHTVFTSDAYTTSGTLVSGDIGTDAYMVYYLDAIPNQEYTLTNSVDSTGFMRISTFDKNAVRLQGMFVKPGESRTIKLSPSAVRMGVNISGVTSYTDEFDVNQWTWTAGTVRNFKRPMLNIGSTAKPFKLREDSILALQTDLYADPATGTNADTVFERDGQYFKSKKWLGMALDGNQPWLFSSGFTGYKEVRLSIAPEATENSYAYKFDGKILTNRKGTAVSSGDRFSMNANGNVYLSISNTDSGWGDGYTPTVDEIKAYYMGWNMYYWNGTSAEIFNNQGPKSWRKINDHGSTTSVLPTTQIDPGLSKDGRAVYWEPYRLVYQLVVPTVEPIVSEGQLMLTDGDNQVEIGSGIVLRERASVFEYNNTAFIGAKAHVTSYLSTPSRKILGVYANGRKDSKWRLTTAYDWAYAETPATNYDKTITYTISFLTLAQSPVVPILGSYAINEKTLLLDLVDSVQQNTARVSVLENKKADKDNPAWITPTLLNGWSSSRFGVLKTSNGIVFFRDAITGGVTTPATIAFTLPKGYRPSTRTEIRVRSSAGGGVESNNSTVIINVDGTVQVQNTIYTAVWLDGVSFIAEQ
ncbi:hypothetical protein B4V02_19415 [Paenibacillus kribbensis]|uniref:Uncharacterized protein n=1 Tax=Paenibacillus kribbensis TaxID=172713 RepID=A0A222WRR9_9BACL|nr:hypothetical protein [Paenibacillus kribbensis]ASR48708.1 hypothetical protein B4V02_19415 [Paenibacillus kribbensis]